MAITTFDTARPAASNTEIVSGAVNAFISAFAPIVDMIERRRTVAMLNGLTDAQLEDMGLARVDIQKVVAAA